MTLHSFQASSAALVGASPLAHPRIMPVDRRRFLRSSLALGATGLAACSDDATSANDTGDVLSDLPDSPDVGRDVAVDLADAATDVGTDLGSSCIDAFAEGSLIEEKVWLGEPRPLRERVSAGHDGRYYTDLKQIDHGTRTTPNEEFYIRTFYPDLIEDDDVESIRLHGLVESELTISAQEIVDAARPMGVQVMECSGNPGEGGYGLLSSAEWSGVPLSEVLARVSPSPEAVGILVSGFDRQTHVSTHSTPGASWVFLFEDIENSDFILASSMNGEPLPPDHGAPVRLVAGDWYGCCSIKWVNEIRFIGADEPATPQMMEFAGRTHQPGVPALAVDFEPAAMQQAAMPVRIDEYQLADGSTAMRVVGILWGGTRPTDALEIRFGNGSWTPVDVCPPMEENAAWTVWEHLWRPDGPGDYEVLCRIADPTVPTNRLDIGRYSRTIRV